MVFELSSVGMTGGSWTIEFLILQRRTGAARLPMGSEQLCPPGSATYVLAMPDFEPKYRDFFVLHFADQAIVADAVTPESGFLTGQRFVPLSAQHLFNLLNINTLSGHSPVFLAIARLWRSLHPITRPTS